MRLYLRAEVEYLGTLRQTTAIEEARLKERGALIGKKIELEDILGVRLSSLDPVIRKFLILDYLDHSTRVKTKLEEVEKRFGVIEKVQEIRQYLPRAHPGAVFDYCLDQPDCSVLEFEQDRENLNRVFHLEGARILFKVPEFEREILVDTVLAADYEDFTKRDSRAIISSHLQKWFSKETAEEILSSPACQERLEHGGEESKIADKLQQFWTEKDDIKLRQDRIMKALKAKKLPFMEDEDRLIQYIEGELDCDVEDLVGEMEVERRLITENHRICVCCISTCKKLFTEYRHSMLLSYEEAIEQAMLTAANELSLLDFEEDDSDCDSDSDSFASYFTDEWGGWLYFDPEDPFLNFYD